MKACCPETALEHTKMPNKGIVDSGIAKLI